MIVSVTFDTKTKALDVSVDGTKMTNVSEVEFMGFGEDSGAVSIRQFEELEDDKAFKLTKIMASENDEDSFDIVEEYTDDMMAVSLVGRLFPKRRF